MGYYRKKIKAGTFEEQFYKSMGFPPLDDNNNAPFILRITLGDMELLDGFYVSLPSEVENLYIEEAIRKYIINEKVKKEVTEKISRISNLDLLDIYNILIDIYNDADIGKIKIIYHINNGESYIEPTDPVSLHQKICKSETGLQYKLLDIVLDIYEPIGIFSEMTEEQRENMLEEFRGIFILYLMDKFGYNEEYSITPKGYDYLNRILAEAEFYIGNYDIFGDAYIKSSGEVVFNTGYGENLIVPVFKKEEIEPYRAIFIITMYLGNMDWLASDPILLFSEDTFQDIFHLIPSSPKVEEEILDVILNEGKSRLEEQKLHEERVRYIENIERHINSDH